MRKLRGDEMAMIFQDPLSSMHPFYTVGDQISEAYLVHNHVGKRPRTGDRRHARPGRASRIRNAGTTTTRTSSPAECASAR